MDGLDEAAQGHLRRLAELVDENLLAARQHKRQLRQLDETRGTLFHAAAQLLGVPQELVIYDPDLQVWVLDKEPQPS